MSSKSAVFWGMMVGSVVGGWVPSLFGADLLSYAGVFGSAVGAVLGILIGYKLTNY